MSLPFNRLKATRFISVILVVAITGCGTADQDAQSTTTGDASTTTAAGPTTTTSAGATTTTSAGAGGGSDLVACAEGEDPTITYYNPSGEEPLRPMFDAFTALYPFLDFEVIGGDPLQAIERIISASGSGDPVGDIMHGGLLEYEAFVEADVPLIDHRPEGESEVPASFPYTGVEYVVPGFMTFPLSYNTDNVAEGEVPTSLQELTEPEWNGRIGIRADQIDWWAGVRAYLGQEAARELGEAIAANGLTVYPGADMGEIALATGALDLGINAASYNLMNAIEAGGPIGFKQDNLEFLVAQPHAVIGLGGSDSTCAVRLFIDWVFTPEGQAIFTEVMHALPAREDVDPPPIMGEVCTGDCELVYETSDMWESFDEVVSEFQEIFVR